VSVRAPYLGQLKFGSRGEYVVLVKRAMSKAGVYSGKTTGRNAGWAGPFFVRAVNKLAKATVLPNVHDGVTSPGHRKVKAIDPSSTYGPHLHVKLAPYFDAYGASRLVAIQEQRRLALVLGAMVHAMAMTIAQRAVIFYSMVNRCTGVRGGLLPPLFGRSEDCSSYRAWVCFVGSSIARRFGWVIPNPGVPSGSYGSCGSTYTERSNPNVRRVSWSRAIPGLAAVHYNGRGSQHVAPKYTRSRVSSMGGDWGPIDENWAYRSPVVILTTGVYDGSGKRLA
jgi:hypothetical protein